MSRSTSRSLSIVAPGRQAASVEGARRSVFDALPPPRPDDVELLRAAGRVLREDVAAGEELWPFARAAMDGVAVRFDDIERATPERPVVLPTVGTAYCGEQTTFDLPPGHAARIATGAALPRGADTVVRQEVVRERDSAVVIPRATTKGEHIFPAGEDARAGEIVLGRGTRLHGGHIAILAALGVERVPVYAVPAIAILATGDELVAPSMPQGLGRVRDSNSYALAAELELAGIRPLLLGIVPDDPRMVAVAMKRGMEADALIVCGGASVGTRDIVRPVLRELGVTFAFEGVPLKPGHPVAFGVAGDCPVFVLPGTPAACRVAFEIVVRPAALAMSGARHVDRPMMRVRLADDLLVRPGRTRFLWARLHDAPLGPWAVVLGRQGSAMLRSSAQAELLVRVESHQEHLPAGTSVWAYLLDATSGERIPTPLHFTAAVAVVGSKNAGKTTLIERLAPLLEAAGIRVGMIKHHSHQDALDDPRRDTGRAAAAGIARTLLVGPRGIVDRIHARNADGGGGNALAEALRRIDDVDLVFVEGFADSSLPRILVRRSGIADDRRIPAGPYVAIVGDELPDDREPCFDWNQLGALAKFLCRRVVETPHPEGPLLSSWTTGV